MSSPTWSEYPGLLRYAIPGDSGSTEEEQQDPELDSQQDPEDQQAEDASIVLTTGNLYFYCSESTIYNVIWLIGFLFETTSNPKT